MKETLEQNVLAFSCCGAALGTSIAFSCRTELDASEITMRKVVPAAAGHDGAKKLPARLADRELSHLQAVLSSASRQFALTAVRGLDLVYWTARVASIDTQYELLTSQKQRLASLSRLLAALAPAGDTASEDGAPTARMAA
jgi:hypothetical protein